METDEEGHSKGFAFVEFEEAVREMPVCLTFAWVDLNTGSSGSLPQREQPSTSQPAHRCHNCGCTTQEAVNTLNYKHLLR
jgi:hypothetical protein